MDKRTIETYNKKAQEYDVEVAEFGNLFPRTMVSTFVKEVGKRGKVLDVGSGSGRDASIFQENGLDVTCIDASVSMVELTQQKGLLSLLADFANIPFPAE